jgi:hypothetical protein
MAETPEQIAYRIVHYSSGPGEICSAIAQAIRDEREACAKIVDPPLSKPITEAAMIAKMMREMFAAAIRAR